ncbi:MAG: hypothetical protein Q8N99_03575 [Nanoarchaeota archaeon]|nr:hypothetical protein [Nanoarchaeota archaeon]
MYLKRDNIPKFWPIPRKGTKYLAVSKHNCYESIPLVVVLRDILKIVRNNKDVKRLINEKQIQVNYKDIKVTNYPISLFDIITFTKTGECYKATLSEKKKMVFEEIKGKESENKPYKIMNKKVLSDKKIQVNLMHGRNMIIKEKVKTGDTLIYNLKEKKIVKILPMEKGREAFIIEGSHAGYKGKIEDIIERGGKILAKINSDKGKINVWSKNIIIIE